jgi:hypothetical protein
MKKIYFLIFFLALGLLALGISPIFADDELEAENTMMLRATTTINGLEKVPSPEQIKNFRNVIKRGQDLFGVRMENSVQASGEASLANRNNNGEIKLEKISAPQFVALYERIRKIGNALWGYKKGEINENRDEEFETEVEDDAYVEMHIQSPSDMSLFKNIRKSTEGKLYGILKDRTNIPEKYFSAIRPFVNVSAENKACVITAIKVKDASLSENNLKFAKDINTAISTRQSCQLEAISNEDGQELAIKDCALDFQTEVEGIKLNTKEVQKNTWQTYRDDLRACSGSDMEAEIMIEDGGNDIY